MKYDYREAVTEDIKAYITDNDYTEYLEMDIDEACEKLFDELWVADSVTGNASGSYTFNRAKAKEYVEPNMMLVIEALREFGYNMEHLGKKLDDEEWEYLDVTIRCYVLYECMYKALKELRDK